MTMIGKKNETITKNLTRIVALAIYPRTSKVRMMKIINPFPSMVTQ